MYTDIQCVCRSNSNSVPSLLQSAKSQFDGNLDKWCAEDSLPQEVIRKVCRTRAYLQMCVHMYICGYCLGWHQMLCTVFTTPMSLFTSPAPLPLPLSSLQILCVKLLVNWLLGQDCMTRERVELVLTLLHGMLARNGDLNNTRRME